MTEPAPHGCTINGQAAMPILISEYNQLITDLAALRAVARGYCPTCGRGDAAPTVADWEQQKQLAHHLAGLLADIYRTDTTDILNEAREALAAAHTALQEQP